MIVQLLSKLFGEDRKYDKQQQKQIEEQAGEVENIVEKQQKYDDPDLNILSEKYGELESGKVIVIELGEAAILLGRKRVRLDAFTSLQKKLKNDYGVELQIYSRRTKLKKEE